MYNLFALFPGVVEFWLVDSSPQLLPACQRLYPEEFTHFFFDVACSAKTSTQCFALNERMKAGSHSSEAIPRSFEHLIRAFDLQPSVAVGIPLGSKYSCSPLATDTSLFVSNELDVCDLPSKTDQTPFSADHPICHLSLSSRCQTPSSRSERQVQRSSVFDLGQIYQAI